MKPFDLCVVMPVYNEESAIGAVLEKWVNMLDSLGIRFQIRAYNDGSKDRTGELLHDIATASHGRIEAIDKPNSGHGPTILRGYQEASDMSEWIFQVDSDDEMPPTGFPLLWNRRSDFDFLVGRRDGRKQPLSRKIVSLVSRITIRLLYGTNGVWDVNAPYRLMKTNTFRSFFQTIPPDTFAPNVILSGLVARYRLRCIEIPVPQHERTTGEVSIKKWKLFRVALRSFRQTCAFAFRAK